jgi:hypothetical protein
MIEIHRPPHRDVTTAPHPNAMARRRVRNELHDARQLSNGQRERVAGTMRDYAKLQQAGGEQMNPDELADLVESRPADPAHPNLAVDQILVIDSSRFHGDDVEAPRARGDRHQQVALAGGPLIGICGEMVRLDDRPHNALDFHPDRVVQTRKQMVETHSRRLRQGPSSRNADRRLGDNGRETARTRDAVNLHQIAGPNRKPRLAAHVDVYGSASIPNKKVPDVEVVVKRLRIAQVHRVSLTRFLAG